MQDIEVRPMIGHVLREYAVGADGQPLPLGTADQQDAAERASAAWCRIGEVSFTVVDADPQALAVATGAREGDELVPLCLHVKLHLDVGQPVPIMGDRVVLKADDVMLTWLVQFTGLDVRSPLPEDMLGDSKAEDWITNEALLALQPDEALLVQIVDEHVGAI